MVFHWLLEHGLAEEQLRGPESLSTHLPLYSGDTVEERGFNRRVDFEPYIIHRK
jgi:hypothetical protein